MADHVRKRVEDAVVTTVTGLSTTGSNVETSPVYAVESTPTLAVYAGRETSESSEPVVMGSDRRLQRIVEIHIDAHCASRTQAYTVCVEVEKAMSADVTLGGLAKDSYIIGTEHEHGSAEEKGVVANMIYRVEYHTSETAPDVVLD